MRTIYRAGGTGAQELGSAPISRGSDLRCGRQGFKPFRRPGRREGNLNAGPFALNPRKIECPNSPVNFAFSYC
jgi:hypothetical protein